MIRRALLSLAAIFAFAAPTAAEDVLSVRAGEHGDYSRLVIPKAPADWKIATSDRKIEITFPSKDYSFELSDIIDKRKAHRVLNARIIDNEKTRALVLSLTCDCPVRTSKSAGNSIVIDIFNAAPVTLAEEEETAQEPVSEAARNAVSATPESMKAARDRMIALLAEARHQGVVQLKIDEEKMELEKRPATEATPAAHSPSAPETDVAPTPRAAPLPEHAADVAKTEPEDTSPPGPPLADGPPEPLVLAENVVKEHCVDASLFHDPEDGALDFSAISHLRQKFDASISEEERKDIAATLALAYIHIGFFEEAAAIASARGAGDHNMSMTAGLADLGAGARGDAAKELAPYRECSPFGELAYAAAAPVDDSHVAPMQEKHVAALKPLTKELRATLAEWLALNAIERDQLTIAREFYEVAKAARGRDRTAALAILESALGEHGSDERTEEENHDGAATAAAPQANAASGPAPVITEELKEIAQTPGPLQARALAIIAKDYEKRADAAYEGFLDDIAAQSGRRNASLAEARASFTGAKALVTAGRMREGIAVLEAAADAAPGAESASRALAQSFIMNGLMGDARTRLAAVSAFFHYRDFVDVRNNGDLNVAVARELAAYGANDLVDEALQGAPEKWRADADAVRALSRLNSGDPHGALQIADKGAMSADLGVVAAKAHERLNDRAGTIALIKASLRRGEGDNEFATAAWRAGDWPLAAEAFSAVPKNERKKTAASRAALAALNTGADALPVSVRDALAEDPETLAALAHMFKAAPAVSVRAIDLLADYAAGVKKEKDFMERGLEPATGDGR